MAAVLSAEGASGEKPGVERSSISANLLQQREGAITHLSRRDQSEGSLARSAGKKQKDPSSPVGTVDQVSCKYVISPFLGLGETKLWLAARVRCIQCERSYGLTYGRPGGTFES